MDLIQTLTTQLGVGEDKAQAVAGGVLGLIQSKVTESAGAGTAQQIAQAIPEASGWQAQAAKLLGGAGGGGGAGGMLGGLAGALGGGGGGGLGEVLGGLAGGGDIAAVAGLIGKLGIGPDKAALVAPAVLNFLKSRLNPETMNMVLKAVPFLSGGGGGAAGGIAGALGGLFGKS